MARVIDDIVTVTRSSDTSTDDLDSRVNFSTQKYLRLGYELFATSLGYHDSRAVTQLTFIKYKADRKLQL